jgi:hypothetical protein
VAFSPPTTPCGHPLKARPSLSLGLGLGLGLILIVILIVILSLSLSLILILILSLSLSRGPGPGPEPWPRALGDINHPECGPRLKIANSSEVRECSLAEGKAITSAERTLARCWVYGDPSGRQAGELATGDSFGLARGVVVLRPFCPGHQHQHQRGGGNWWRAGRKQLPFEL